MFSNGWWRTLVSFPIITVQFNLIISRQLTVLGNSSICRRLIKNINSLNGFQCCSLQIKKKCMLGSTSGDRSSLFIFTLTWRKGLHWRRPFSMFYLSNFHLLGCKRSNLIFCTSEGMLLVLCQRLFFCIIGHYLCYMCLIPLIFMSLESSV